MVESENEREVIVESKRRNRKPSFFVNEISVITEKVQNHLAVIQSKFSNNLTNKKKNQIWKEITEALNEAGMVGRTLTEVKDKWRSMHSTAKKVFRVCRAKKLLKFLTIHRLSAV